MIIGIYRKRRFLYRDVGGNTLPAPRTMTTKPTKFRFRRQEKKLAVDTLLTQILHGDKGTFLYSTWD